MEYATDHATDLRPHESTAVLFSWNTRTATKAGSGVPISDIYFTIFTLTRWPSTTAVRI